MTGEQYKVLLKKRIPLLIALAVLTVSACLVAFLHIGNTYAVDLSRLSLYQEGGYTYNAATIGTSSANAIHLATPDDLILFRDYLASPTNAGKIYAVLDNDIDMYGVAWEPIETAREIDINGNYHVIENLSASAKAAFIVSAEGVAMRYLGLVDCTNYYYATEDTSNIALLVSEQKKNYIDYCFVKGTLVVSAADGVNVTNVGGIAGIISGGNIRYGFSLCDIVVDEHCSAIGGIAGTVTAKNACVQFEYSSGSITAYSKENVGGLIGVPYVAQNSTASTSAEYSYTTMNITLPSENGVYILGKYFTDSGGDKNSYKLYYDKDITFQYQQTPENNKGLSTSDLINQSITYFVKTTTNYPQIKNICNSRSQKFREVSALSTAVIEGTPYDYCEPNTEITLYNGNPLVEWSVSSGVEEYYYDGQYVTNATPGVGTSPLSGNAYNEATGKYLFTSEGSVEFIAKTEHYSRTFTVNCAPYIPIPNVEKLDAIRMYNAKGAYHYKVTNPFDCGGESAPFRPIEGFKGSFDGGDHSITGLVIDAAGTDNGLFGTVLDGSEISHVFLNNAKCTVPAEAASNTNSALLVGSAQGNVNINNCLITGTVTTAADDCGNVGSIVGSLGESGDVASCVVSGLIDTGTATTGNAGGAVGSSHGFIENVFSSVAVKTALTTAGGILGRNGDVSDLMDSLYVGGITNLPATPNAGYTPICGMPNGFEDSCYYDKNAAAYDGAIGNKIKPITPNTVPGLSGWSAASADCYPTPLGIVSGNTAYNNTLRAASVICDYDYYYVNGGNSRNFTVINVAGSTYDVPDVPGKIEYARPISSFEDLVVSVEDTLESVAYPRYIIVSAKLRTLQYKVTKAPGCTYSSSAKLPLTLIFGESGHSLSVAVASNVTSYTALDDVLIVGKALSPTSAKVTAPTGYTATTNITEDENGVISVEIVISDLEEWGVNRVHNNLW